MKSEIELIQNIVLNELDGEELVVALVKVIVGGLFVGKRDPLPKTDLPAPL